MWKKSVKTKEPKNLERAYEYAVFLLSLKLRTIGEVLKKMQGRGYAPLVIEEVISRLKSQKYLDDQRYAEVYLDNLKKYKNFGFYGIKKKLMDVKLPMNIIETILQSGLSLAEEEKIARRFLKKEGFAAKIKSADEEIQYRTFDEESGRAKQKLAAKLKARGFRIEVISKLLF